MTSDSFLNHLDELIQSKHLLHHDFYKAWSCGNLSLDCLKEYAKDYYHHVKAFPTYLSATHSRTEDAMTRRILLQNLVEEEGGSPNHPELWRNFALGLGVEEKELDAHVPSREMTLLISKFREICSSQTLQEAVGALYAYESQIPAISISKIEGLKAHYNTKEWEYFSVHIAADKEHAAQERALLSQHLQEDDQRRVYSAVDQVLDLLQNFLSGMCEKYQICSTMGAKRFAL